MPGENNRGSGSEAVVPMSFSLSEKLKMRVEFEAKKRGVTVSKYLREALNEKLAFDAEMDRINAEAATIKITEEDE
jgi:predicted DNA-binding protein